MRLSSLRRELFHRKYTARSRATAYASCWHYCAKHGPGAFIRLVAAHHAGRLARGTALQGIPVSTMPRVEGNRDEQLGLRWPEVAHLNRQSLCQKNICAIFYRFKESRVSTGILLYCKDLRKPSVSIRKASFGISPDLPLTEGRSNTHDSMTP